MISKVYSVFDHKVMAFMPPWYARTDGEAIRSFSDALLDPKASMSKYPADYSLLYLGQFNDETGRFTQSETDVRTVIKGLEVERPMDPFSRDK